MKTMINVCLALFLTSCASVKLQPRIVDPALEPYVSEFESIWGQKIAFTVEFSSTLGAQYEGMCTTYPDGTRVVDISSTYWPQNSEPARRQLIYHELGHCALDRGHWSVLDGNPNGCTWDLNGNCDPGYPLTIMYPVIFGDDGHYETNEEYYIQELFANDPKHEDTYKGSGGETRVINETEDSDFKHSNTMPPTPSPIPTPNN